MTQKKRLAGLRKAMRKLHARQNEFSCLAVRYAVNWIEKGKYAVAMGETYPSGYTREIGLSDIIAVFPKYRLSGLSAPKVFAEVMDFRVWLVAMYYGYVASGAQEEVER